MLSLRIAWRYLFARKSHNAVNIISLVALLGVAVASMAMVAVLSVFNGFTHLAAARLSLLDPPLLAVAADGSKTIGGADSLCIRLAGLPQIAAAEPMLREQGLAVMGEHQMAVTLVGLPEGHGHTMPLTPVIIDGEDLSGAGVDAATLSVGVAVRLGAHPYSPSPLEVYTPRRTGRYNPANPLGAFRADTLQVTAVYRTDQSELDADRVIMPLQMLRGMLDYSDGEATALRIIPTPGVGVDEARRAAAGLTGAQLTLLDGMEQQPDAFMMIRVEKWISFLMLAFILVIASFNIISTLSLLIIEKQESTAVMRAMGATTSMIDRIYVVEGWLISIFGGVAGVIAGTALVLAQQWGGFIKLGGDPAQMSITTYPVRLEPLDLAGTLAVVAVIGLATGLLTLAIRKR